MVVWFVRSEEAACKRDTLLRQAKQAFIPLGDEGGQAITVATKGHDQVTTRARSARHLFKDPLELVL